jgi:hypothetical protein
MRRVLISLLMLFYLMLASALPGSFADEQARKPLCVLVFDETCKAWCTKVRPVMAELKQTYADRVEFAELDATQKVLADTKKRAKDLGILGWFTDDADYVPVVLIFDNRRNLIKELPGPKTKEDYSSNIDKAISHSK